MKNKGIFWWALASLGWVWVSGGSAWARPQSQCDVGCPSACQGFLSSANKATPKEELPTLASSTCKKTKLSTGEVLGCSCRIQISKGLFEQPFLYKGKEDRCFRQGRRGQCLYKASEFPGCDESAADTSCADICGELLSRLHADLSESPEFKIQSTACVGGFECGCVLKDKEGACYKKGPHSPPEALSECVEATKIWPPSKNSPPAGRPNPTLPPAPRTPPDSTGQPDSPTAPKAGCGCHTRPGSPTPLLGLGLLLLCSMVSRRRLR